MPSTRRFPSWTAQPRKPRGDDTSRSTTPALDMPASVIGRTAAPTVLSFRADAGRGRYWNGTRPLSPAVGMMKR
jgi:hypothetical protein